jgi:hypothetical protein
VDLEPWLGADTKPRDLIVVEPFDVGCACLPRRDDFVRQGALGKNVGDQDSRTIVLQLLG